MIENFPDLPLVPRSGPRKFPTVFNSHYKFSLAALLLLFSLTSKEKRSKQEKRNVDLIYFKMRKTVNQGVTGSSPVGGAKSNKGEPPRWLSFVCFLPRKARVRSDHSKRLMADRS